MSSSLEATGHISQILGLVRDGKTFAVATVIHAEGSAPAKAGAKALIEPNGTIHGTIGGGGVEAKAMRLTCEVIETGSPVLFDSVLRGPGVHDHQPICGGIVRVLVDPTAVNFASDYRRAEESLTTRQGGVWLTAIRGQRKLTTSCVFLSCDEMTSSHGEGRLALLRKPAVRNLVARCVERGTTTLLQGPVLGISREVLFVEPLRPKPQLLIIGGGHVGQAVARLGAQVGFGIILSDDRPEFAAPDRFPPGTAVHCGDVESVLARQAIEHDTHVVIATRNHQQDSAALRACLKTRAGYIGMIGSRRKVPLVRQHFLKSGWATAPELHKVHAPIGLDIGAVTVPEIAVSIIAEIIAVRRKGNAQRKGRTR